MKRDDGERRNEWSVRMNERVERERIRWKRRVDEGGL